MFDPTDRNKRRERRGLVLVSGRLVGTQRGMDDGTPVEDEVEVGVTARTGASARDH